MALPARLSERERRAILRARMVAWEWDDAKRAKSREHDRQRRMRALAAQRSR